jgi:hypothetical protein
MLKLDTRTTFGMGILKQFIRYMRTFFQMYPKVVCFHCGKRFRLGDDNDRVMHYVIPNSDMILQLHFCNWNCHDHRIVDRSNRATNIIALKY